ncbi:MAG TPA: hypothetical protein VK698_15980 [Kofleriaceae bacterium]|nr:hypothetical protein [Kofleriaceae bacterium]
MIEDLGHGWSVRIPATTTAGAPVEVERGERDGGRRVHARSADESEVYVEILTYPGLVDHRAAAAGQRTFLEEQSPGGRLSETAATTFRGRDATAFDFVGILGGRRKARRFVFVDSASRTCRVVTDPSSPANAGILDSLVIGD